MSDMDRELGYKFREESDDMLFNRMELSERAKRNIRQQAAAEKAGRRFAIPKAWMMGTAALAAAVVLMVGYPMLQQPSVPTPGEQPIESLPPSNGGAAGSELSQLITTPLSSAEEAKAAFGDDLLVPAAAPEGFTLSETVAVGMEGEPARDVIFTYASGDKTVTFVASRMPAAFPADLFTPTQVGGADGFVFEQPGMTELFWMDGGIQYAVTGPISAEDAMKLAESAE